MTRSGQTLCLCMIVKDEAPVIARCLASVRPFIDHWIVVDTGSTDGTQAIVRDALADLPGEIVERAWVDFATNRSEALTFARPHADYSLVIDADDELIVPPGFALPALDASSYELDISSGTLAYCRAQLFSNALVWRYVGVLHEVAVCDGTGPAAHLPLTIRHSFDGRRQREREATCREDAAILTRALDTETDPFLVARYTFYLAQTYRDLGETRRAVDTYLARADLRGSAEEVYVALVQAGRLKETIGDTEEDVLATYRRAAALLPHRAEAFHDASRFCRHRSRFEEGWQLARRGEGLEPPPGALFVESWIYAYGLADERSVHAFWTGRYDDCVHCCDVLLREGRFPAEMRERIETNRRLAAEKMAAAAPRPVEPLSRHGWQGHTGLDTSPPGALLTRSNAMTPPGQTICLCMIVKNEAHVIRRCLASVRSLIHHWIIVDTGSTDGTQDIVRATMADIPGELVERPWVDFAHNRSEALVLARPHAAYSLVIDADDTLEIPDGFAMSPLTAGGYTLRIADAGIAYQRTQIVRSDLPWRYEGVLHEFLSCEGSPDVGSVAELTMRRNHDGARRRDPQTYQRDAALLEQALTQEARPFFVSRYRFYLAQSYRDCGMKEKALENYLARADLGFWAEEVYVALLSAARLQEQLGHTEEQVLQTYERATDAVPTRAEALHGAARFCRTKDRFEKGYWYALRGVETPRPADGLFIEPWIYEYGLLDELGVHAYWSGRFGACREACARLLREGKLPDDMRERISSNLRLAVEKVGTEPTAALPQAPAAATPDWSPGRPLGGTELMVEALRHRMGAALDGVNLCINLYDPAALDARPLVVWIHHDVNQEAIQWCGDAAKVAPVACFVFVSHWQRERYLASFALPPERCIVICHALEQTSDLRRWEAASVLRCAYTSTPFRGLDVLLDAWDQLPAGRAELHIWSSMKLYAMDDAPYQPLLDRAQRTPGVVYHGLAPNSELRAALRGMHILSYPSTFAETACLSVMEAMAAGCRVVVPAFGALPETTGGYARLYPWCADRRKHADLFAETLTDELDRPWRGRPDLALAQQNHCAFAFAWSRCLDEWRALIGKLQAHAR